jgi:hypothetical protein
MKWVYIYIYVEILCHCFNNTSHKGYSGSEKESSIITTCTHYYGQLTNETATVTVHPELPDSRLQNSCMFIG